MCATWVLLMIALLAPRPIIITRRSLAPLAEATAACVARLGEAEVLDLDHEHVDAKELASRIEVTSPPIIIAVGPSALKLALDGAGRTPIVFTMISSPADHFTGLPNNVVGVQLNPDPTVVLRTLHRIAPRTHRVLSLYDPARSLHLVEDTVKAAEALHLELWAIRTPDRAAVARTLVGPPSDFDAILLILDLTVLYPEAVAALLRLGAARNIPVVGLSWEHCSEGALLSVVSSPADLGDQAARMAQAVRAGKQQARVSWPSRLKVLVNPAVAQRMRIELPDRIEGIPVERCILEGH